MSEMDDYDFELPREQIAQHPLPNRTDAKLMLVDRKTGEIDHAHVRDLPDYIHAGDAVVLNNSRVVPAKLVGYRAQTRGRWQGLFLAADEQTGVWEVLTKTRGKLVDGELIIVQDRQGRDALNLRCVMRT
ncbi:MAG TPA: S-adenosylmethionine:tRNA ribosyltransferase-isomerase, partial [Planctomycetaceae bacterium]|nr:S-adenosylmethionine:tRNA ribosyltransferase-isomerase [Planctomycetaceae bacterium]